MNATDFLTEIAANPNDESARLVYADWLDDRGDARAELVRVQCELAMQERPDGRTLPLLAAEARLLSKHKAEWLSELRCFGVADAWFARGVVSGLEISAHDFIHYARLLFDQAPTIRALKLRGIKRRNARELTSRLRHCRHLRRIRDLDLAEQRIGSEGVMSLLKGSQLSHLESLELSGNSLRNQTVDRLTQAGSFASLKRLSLARNLLTADAASYIVAWDAAGQLTHLDLSYNQLREAGNMAIASARCFHELQELSLLAVRLSDNARVELASSSYFPQLSTVHLSWAARTSDAALQERFGSGLKLG